MIRFSYLSSVFVSILFCGSSATAQTTERLLIYPNGESIDVSATDGLEAYLDSGASYCCELRDYGVSTSQFSSSGSTIPRSSEFTSVLSDTNQELAVRYRGQVNPTSGRGYDPSKSRVCFQATEPGVVGVAPYQLYFQRATSSGETRARCEETTLRGGFNSFASDYLFLELVSNQRQALANAITVTVQGFGADGQSLFELTVSVAGRKDIAINPLIGGGQIIGKLVLLSDAPQGAYSAHVAEYTIDRNNRRTGFTLVGRQELNPTRR